MKVAEIRRMQKQREEEHKQFMKAMEKLKESKKLITPIEDKFVATDDQDAINEDTTGRQSLSDYRMKRQRIERDMATLITGDKPKRQKVNHKVETKKLSFTEDLEKGEEEADETGAIDKGSPENSESTTNLSLYIFLLNWS
eukprot:TRINITY_DN5197_c0_g1_i3.p2 TRINITY_DN5197_c0_g1~~TRINITY_DN5197_c0_g1_i3.p2  ORF type:complete len:165 (+),score=56.85 TRINITY_DN5197_c0_g1_i3:73-495(+)